MRSHRPPAKRARPPTPPAHTEPCVSACTAVMMPAGIPASSSKVSRRPSWNRATAPAPPNATHKLPSCATDNARTLLVGSGTSEPAVQGTNRTPSNLTSPSFVPSQR
jgi:hypothetical protein